MRKRYLRTVYLDESAAESGAMDRANQLLIEAINTLTREYPASDMDIDVEWDLEWDDEDGEEEDGE